MTTPIIFRTIHSLRPSILSTSTHFRLGVSRQQHENDGFGSKMFHFFHIIIFSKPDPFSRHTVVLADLPYFQSNVHLATTNTMLYQKRTVCLFLVVVTSMIWSCRATNPRIRRRAVITQEPSSSSTSTTATQNQEEMENDPASTTTDHLQGAQSTNNNNSTCAAISVSGFPSCAAFCEQETGYSLNTFIELDHGSNGKQYCCACFSGDAYCSDDIPECVDFVNLDFSGLSIKWNNSEEKDEESTQVETSSAGLVDTSMDVSCMDINVTDSLSCLDFCQDEAGDSNYQYRGNAARERYYCVCKSTLIEGENVLYCQDSMSDRWKEALGNLTILPLTTGMGGIVP